MWGSYDREGAAPDLECDATDAMVSGLDLGDTRGASGRSVRWNLHRLLDEYARQHGRAALLRERIDAAGAAPVP